MERRRLGRSGLLVTRMGLGLAALGRPGYINLGHHEDLERNYDVAVMEARAHGVLDAAWNAGIRYFDAARSYGRAEPFLASWLARRRIQPPEITIGSKWGYTYTANWQVQAEHHEIKEHSLAVLRRQLVESRGWLGDHLNLYQIHSATLESDVLENEAVLVELAALQAQGVRIGLSLSGARQAETLRRALDVTIDGRRLFDAVQATWNLLEPSAGIILAQARAAGMGVIVKEALANGRLTPRNNDPTFRAKAALLQTIAAERETTIDAIALAAVLAQPWADVVLSGAARASHLRDNVAALDVAWDEALARRLADLAEPPDVYWRVRGQLAWN